jgi:hypothetical protein
LSDASIHLASPTQCSNLAVEAWLREIGELRRLELMRFTLCFTEALYRESMPQCWIREDRFPVVKVTAIFPGDILDQCELRVRLAVHRAFQSAGFPVAPNCLHLHGSQWRLRITARPEWGDI